MNKLGKNIVKNKRTLDMNEICRVLYPPFQITNQHKTPCNKDPIIKNKKISQCIEMIQWEERISHLEIETTEKMRGEITEPEMIPEIPDQFLLEGRNTDKKMIPNMKEAKGEEQDQDPKIEKEKKKKIGKKREIRKMINQEDPKILIKQGDLGVEVEAIPKKEATDNQINEGQNCFFINWELNYFKIFFFFTFFTKYIFFYDRI